jgi:LCP family protein required for cell wall assembly
MNNNQTYNYQNSGRDRITKPLQQDLSWEKPPRKKRRGCCCCSSFLFILIGALLAVWVMVSMQGRTNILFLGIDSREDNNLGRSDTMILTTFVPSEPYVGMLSIPRDLWVTIPDYGANRINTAHFFAEADQPGTGPQAAMEAVRLNFGVDVHYYVRLHLIGFINLVDAIGGIDIDLTEPKSGYEAGSHHFDGSQALAFVRDRSHSDDFSRMQNGQIFLFGVIKKFLSPLTWLKLPEVWSIMSQNFDTDVPIRILPQLAYTLLRVGIDGIENQIIEKDMVVPFTTGGGANVLAPNWDAINPVLLEMFGQ